MKHVHVLSYLRSSGKSLREVVFIVLGISCAALGLEGFIIPNGLIDGGAMGISLLTATVGNIPLSVLVFLVNFPFIVLGYRNLGLNFAIKTLAAITGLALVLYFVKMEPVTNDSLLTPIFGGAFLGAGIGFAIRGGAVIDGTEILALSLSKRLSGTVGDFILAINIIIFSAAAILINIETAMYSVVTYFSASRLVDFITTGIEEYTNVTIVSAKSEQIRMALTEQFGRGVTIFSGKRGYGKRGHVEREIDIIVCIVTRLEISSIKTIIQEIDPDAFVYFYSVNETMGGMVKQRPLH
ncbi:MAG: YitT family protein [Chitinophagales bacterium]|nr:YitT family protein [Chitinophagales bacterium]